MWSDLWTYLAATIFVRSVVNVTQFGMGSRADRKLKEKFDEFVLTDDKFKKEVDEIIFEHNRRIERELQRKRGMMSQLEVETKLHTETVKSHGDLFRSMEKYDWLKLWIKNLVVDTVDRHRREHFRIHLTPVK